MDQVLVLVVEDDPLIQMDVESALQDAGFEVITASQGTAAIAALDKHHSSIRAVVTDIQLGPGPSGWEVAKHAREIVPSMSIVYVTGDSGHEWVSLGVPNSQLIHKPFAFSQLITAVASSLNGPPPAD